MSKDSHSFSVSVACEVGVPGAILLQHLCFLQKANVSSGENWQEKWVKRSAASIAKTYPYWSAKQVSAICDNLEKHGYIFSRIQNATKTDRAKSYLLTAKGLHLMGEIPFAQMENGFSKKGNANAEMENDILPNGGMLIKVDCTSFIPSFVEEENPASRFSSSSENQPLEAKKEKTPPPSSAPPPPKKDYGNLCPDCHGAGWHLGRNGRETCETCLGNGLNSERLLHPPFTPIGTIEPQPPKVVRLYDNELPGVTVVDSVPGTYETKRGKSQRRNEPHIHPENETCFSYFSDPAKAREAWKDWIDYKYEQHRERYKAAKSELSKLRQLFKQFSGDSEKFEAAVNHSIGNLYKGVFPPKQEKENGQFQHLDKAQQQHLKYARFVADLRNGSAFADAGKVDYVTGEKPV